MPPRPSHAPKDFALLRALRTNVLDLWPDEAFESEVFQHSFLGRKLFLLNSPEAIRHVLIENDVNYGRSPIRTRILRPIAGRGLLLSEGETWRRQRRTAAPAFAPRATPVLVRHFASAAQDGIAELEKNAGKPVDLFEHVHRWSIEIAGRSMFSLNLAKYRRDLYDHIHRYVPRLAQPYFWDVLLPMRIPSPHDLIRNRFSKSWMGLLDRIIGERLHAPPSEGPADLFDLLRSARDPETGEGFSREQLRDQVATMIVAGHETTSVAMFWALYLVASSVNVQEKLAAEVRDVDLGPDAAAEALAKLPYARAIVSETLRLYPSVFMIVRHAIGEDAIGNLDIPAGSTVMIVPWVLHRHRSHWQNPEVFDPNRFVLGAAPSPRMAYLPFGIGPRVCIGAQFAISLTTIMLASLVKAFDIGLADNTPVTPICVATARPNYRPQFRLRARSQMSASERDLDKRSFAVPVPAAAQFR
jgi:unspecific monooxygenase